MRKCVKKIESSSLEECKKYH
jgi:Timeless protein